MFGYVNSNAALITFNVVYCPMSCRKSVTVVKTLEAVDQDKQGTRGIGFGQLVTARDAIWTQ